MQRGKEGILAVLVVGQAVCREPYGAGSGAQQAGKGGIRGRYRSRIKKAACRVARQAVESARCGRSGSPRSGSRRRVLQEGGITVSAP